MPDKRLPDGREHGGQIEDVITQGRIEYEAAQGPDKRRDCTEARQSQRTDEHRFQTTGLHRG